MNNQPQDLVDLAHAHVTQHTANNIKSEWSVEANITDKVLAKLPADFSESEMFKVLEFAREYELTALNVGIQHGKKITGAVYDKQIEGLMHVIAEMRSENERISEALAREMFKSMGGEEI